MSSAKHTLFRELIAEVRRSQAASARFDRAVADAIGLNLTDMGCLDVLSQTGPLTAGQLAQRTGLSSGAMTTAIDRLEAAGYARRARDGDDRRRVLVELADKAAAIDQYFTEHMKLSDRLYHQYTAEQIGLLREFAKQSADFNERRAGEVEQQIREARPRLS